MTTGVFLMLLLAALLHAAWNALVKANADRFVMMAIMMASQILVAVIMIPFLPVPPQESWPYILSSTVLSTAYCIFLVKAYQYGDLSHVYPIARGSAPLIIALISVVLIGETLTSHEIFSVTLIALGIMSLTLTQGRQAFRSSKAIFFALGTGVFIAGYTIIDGLGARVTGNPHSYTFWAHLFTGIPITILALWFRRGKILVSVRSAWRVGMLGGIVSLLAYWIVIWAMTQAPIALVSAVRETSMVFAVLIGALILKERIDLVRLASIGITLIGTTMLKLSR